MGRSKFPGKPPKTVTRKRIKVLGRPEPTQSDSVTVAENIYYGLSLFNETFGDNEKEHRPFHGFSNKEAKLSTPCVKTSKKDPENDKLNQQNDEKKINESLTENLLSKTLETENNYNQQKINDHNNSNLPESTSNNIIVVVKETVNVNKKSSEDGKKLKSGNKSKVGKGVVKFKRVVRTPILKAVNNILDRHQRTRQLRNSTAKRLLQRAKYNITSNNRNITIQSSDKSNAIKKFVLPMRSAHSSRVIKPNKRFIEESEQSSNADNEDAKQSKKSKTAGKSHSRTVKSKIKQYKNNSTASINTSKSLKNYKFKSKEDTRSRKHSGDVKKSTSLVTKTKMTNKINNNVKSSPTTIIGKLSESSTSESIPSKVLPDSNTPNFGSSRIKTRLRIPSENPIDTENLSLVNNDNSIRSNKKIDIINSVILSSSCSDDNDECTQKTDKNCDIESQNRLDTFESDSSLSESTSESNHNSEDEQSEWTGMKLDGGKVILRKARLKLENKNSGGTEGPFSVTSIQHSHNSSNNNNHNTSINSSLTGTVKCGVCGAVRFYRFVNQARKFGIYSCESCRKFISKIIKHQACAKSTNTTLPVLQCHKGDGMCLVPPVVRSQQWNLMRCAYKARCPACWLKMCLKCYNIPTSIKTGLNSLLPPLHRDPVMSLGSMSQDSDGLDNQKTVGSKINWPAEDSLEKNLFKSAISWSGIPERKVGYQSGQGLLANKFNKVDYPISMSLSKKRKKDTRIKIRKKIKSPLVLSPPSACSSPTASQSTQSTQPLRQRVDLKGPRVKHVCRSASVALGQPIATFPSTDEKDESSDVSNKNATVKTKDEDKRPDTREKVSKSNQENNANSTNNNTVQTSYVNKKSKVQSNNLVSSHHSLRTLVKSGKNKIHEISIDFWEQYDPTEVGAKGFALIASETFPIPAICFLCGSAGKEPLIHCQCCCEPYHAFCLEPSEWNACVQPDWCCPRCTICQTCSQRTGPKLSCIRCRQSFHHSCLSKSGVNARLYSPDRPYICQNCVKCKSCGSEGVNVYVGNLPLCSMCFKLRQRGNYCPLCQRCYNENDFNTKMMECNECSCWVHAHCEGLSDEFYEVLSYLPDSIEFTCSQCSPNPNSTSWRNAIDKELKTGFVAVLKSLSKNRKVCNALNWSPRKECLCKPVVSVRKLLDFSNIDNNISKLNSNKELTINDNKETDYNNYDKFPSNGDNNKIDPLSRFDFEIDEQQQQQEVPRRGLRKLKQKFHLKECSVRVKNCIVKDGNDSSSNGETNNQQSLNSNDNSNSNSARECLCLEENILMKPSPSLMSVKRKVNNNEYQSLFQFHCDMEHVVNRAGKQDLTLLYHRSLQEIFPWFDPKQAKVNSYDEELSSSSADMDGDRDSSISKLNDSILETWKEEVVKASKAITMRTGNVYSEFILEDTRVCALCKGIGDGQENREGRLLYCGQNEWVHSNCALWSNEVFEEIDGSLQNVHSAISRGRMIRCGECGKKGASVGCCAKNCGNTFHYPCARNAGLGLNDDKTIYCALHLANCINKNQNDEENFSLKRLVYVEFGRKKKKFVEPDRVKVMIGSLMIDCLGTVMPEFSDSNEKIIPNNYKCSRLYWSTINPMKIVRYYIRTYVKTCTTDVNLDMDHNVTIDHSKEQETEERLKIENLAIKQTLDSLIDSVYNREVDDNLAEQNNTDLLPPEITDVIFQDLPHDLLDGISMQDIFPKMSYEDFLAMDLRNDGVFGNDILKDEILSSDVDDEMIKSPSDGNKLAKDSSNLSEIAEQNDIWLHLETKSSVQELMDDLSNSKSQKFGGKELKRSKSEVIGSNPLVVGGQRRHHQRSCSLTWSCKLDGTYGPTVKRRKLSRPSTAITGEVNSFVVDSAEKNSMFHELRIPESIMVTVGRASSPTINESVREFKYCIDDQSINRRIMPTREDKDHKRLLWHTRQQPRLLQVDGPADPSSASECSSPEYDVEEKLNSDSYKMVIVNERNNFSDIDSEESLKIPQLDGADDISSDDESHTNQIDTIIYVPHTIEDGPVTCKRCQCTYRTHDSYNRHLSNCDIVTTSDSDSETIDNKSASSSTFFDNLHSPHFVTLSSPSQGRTLSTDYPDIQVTSPLEASVPSPHTGLQIEPIAQALITPQIHSHETVETLHQTVLTSNEVIVQTQYTRTTTTLPNSSAAVLPQESRIKIIEITDSPAHEQTSPSLVLSNDNQNQHQAVVSPYISPVIQPDSSVIRDIDETLINHHQQQATMICNNKVLKPKPRVVKAKTKVIKPQYIKNNLTQQHLEPIRFQTIHQNSSPMVHLQQAPRANAPTVILQQVPSSGIMSAYVDTLQQQSDQNLQYITTIGGQETAYKPQFISTNQLVPGAYIHTASDNLLALSNGGISVLPSVQIAQPQPAVLGTIIQQQPNAIQCGVISSEQLVLSSTPTLEMFTDSTGSMFVSSQPMYYGLETIVSNTVMSSSQFVTGAVPQVLASSYQTTTQVFQASKLMEPIVDVQTMPSVSTVQAVQGIPSVPLQTQNQTVPTVQSIQNIPAVQTVQNVPNIGSYVVMNSQPVETPIASTTSLNHPGGNIGSTTPGDQNFEGLSGSIITTEPMTAKLQIQEPEVVNPVAPYIDMSSRSMSAAAAAAAAAAVARPIQNHQSIPRIAVRPSPVSQQTVTQPNYGQWKFISEPIYSVEQQTVSSSTRPYLDSKHVSENTSMIKSSLSSKVSPLSNHCVTQRDIVKKLNNCDVGNNGHDIYHGLSSNFVNSITSQQAGLNNINNNSNSCNVSNLSNNSNNQNKIMTSVAPTRPMNRVLPMLAVVPKPEAIKPDINDIEEPTKEIKPIIKSESIETLEKSTIELSDSVNKNFTDKFFNDKPLIVDDNLISDEILFGDDKLFVDKKNQIIVDDKVIDDKLNEDKNVIEDLKLPEESNKSEPKLIVDNKEEIEEKNLVDSSDKKDQLQNASLKIVLQKQLQDGSYKITHNIKTTKASMTTTTTTITTTATTTTTTTTATAVVTKKSLPKITSVEILPTKQTPHIGSLQLLPIKKFTLKANKVEEIPRIILDNNTIKDSVTSLSKPKITTAVKTSRLLSKSKVTSKVDPVNNVNNVNNSNNNINNMSNINAPKKNEPKLMYEIKSQDGFTHTASSMSEVWDSVFQAVQAARKTHNLPPLTHNPLTENLGLDNNATVYLVEQLAGVNRCTKYKPRYHNLKPPKSFDSDILSGSEYGSARAEPFKERKVHDMFSWLASRHRQQPKILAVSEMDVRRAVSTNLPMAMRFRMLKETSKESVGVYHSHIHGRGLFCLRDIEAGEMVIEYAGEVIRASLTDKREKYYDSKHIGCYMFKIDDHLVVDATMKGNAARFINHSCEPNCYSKVVDILGKKHILIFALRRITQGEELTYDYKFPFEDIKIPCTCGSRKCRKYLN